MKRDEIKALMNAILARQGKPAIGDEQCLLRDAGFRSMDFSELALRVENVLGRELDFEAAALRRITTVADVCDFFERVASA